MSQTKNQLEKAFQTFQEEYAKFSEKGNKSAGTRARGALADLGKLSKELRKEIQESKNAAS